MTNSSSPALHRRSLANVPKPVLAQWFSAYLPPAAWATVIFLLSAQGILPSFEMSTADYVFKKTAHITVYAVLYFLLWRAVQKTISPPERHIHWALPMFLTLCYALSDELHQNFVPGRYGTIRDVGYDMLGAGVVFLRQYRYI